MLRELKYLMTHPYNDFFFLFIIIYIYFISSPAKGFILL